MSMRQVWRIKGLLQVEGSLDQMAWVDQKDRCDLCHELWKGVWQLTYKAVLLPGLQITPA